VRRKKSSGGGGANWMDTYGDMVTLLLCFFVLLYSISTISEASWKALVMSFNPDAVETVTVTSGDDGPNADPNDQQVSGLEGTITQEQIESDIELLYESIKQYVTDQGMQDNVSVTKGDGKVFVTFNQVVFFDGNDPTLREDSKPILEAVAEMISSVAVSIEEIRLMGHTAQADPNVPNDIVVDRNLSAQRAANALAHIQQFCTVDPARLISEGYGQWRPVASNDTTEGRAKNRRVEMIVSGRDLERELEEGIQSYLTDDFGITAEIETDTTGTADADTESPDSASNTQPDAEANAVNEDQNSEE